MLATVRTLQPRLQRCGPKARQADGALDEKLCVKEQPRLLVGGRGVSGPVFLANAAYREYLFKNLQAQTFEMETAALAHVAAANQVPYIAFRSLSDLAGAEGFNADVGALFASGLAEANEAEVTLSFLRAWHSPSPPCGPPRRRPMSRHLRRPAALLGALLLASGLAQAQTAPPRARSRRWSSPCSAPRPSPGSSPSS
jgi:adenosylhomocysteine nucleosidase